MNTLERTLKEKRDKAFNDAIEQVIIGFMGASRFVFYTAVTIACAKYIWY